MPGNSVSMAMGGIGMGMGISPEGSHHYLGSMSRAPSGSFSGQPGLEEGHYFIHTKTLRHSKSCLLLFIYPQVFLLPQGEYIQER